MPDTANHVYHLDLQLASWLERNIFAVILYSGIITEITTFLTPKPKELVNKHISTQIATTFE